MAAPVTSILDNFNRANASTLGASWGLVSNFNAGVNTTAGITGNQAYNPWGQFGAYLAMYWNAQQYSPNAECYMTLATKSATNDTDNPAVYACLGGTFGSGPTPNYRGYVAGPNASNNQWTISRIDNGVSTIISGTTTQTYASGDKMWLQKIENALSLYWFNSSNSTWSLVGTASDATYPTGYIGYYTPGNHVDDRFDDFGGGNIPNFGNMVASITFSGNLNYNSK